MKFGILIDQLRYGGVEKVAIEETKALGELGHEAILFVLHRTRSPAYGDLLKGIRTVYVSDLVPRPLRLSFKFPFLRFFSLFHVTYAFLGRFIRVEHVDIIVAHGTYNCFAASAFSRRMMIPFIAFIWDPVSYILKKSYLSHRSIRQQVTGPVASSLGAILDRWICTKASIVLTGSRYHVPLLKELCLNGEKVRVLYPGIHPRINIEASKLEYALMVTAWKPGKDPEYAIELAQHTKGLKFVLAGSWMNPEFQDEFMKKVVRAGMTERILVKGKVPEDQLMQLYSNALTFLQVKADVGFGLPALEAAGQGCTFIIPEHQGVCDLFTPKDDGFFVQEGNTSRIVELLEEFQANPEQATQMGQRAWKTSNKYSWRAHAQHLYEIAFDISRPNGL